MENIDDFLDMFSNTESYFFYNGEVEIQYNKEKHVYTLVKDSSRDVFEPIKLQSATQVLHKSVDKSEILIPWACKEMAMKLIGTLPTINGIVDIQLDELIDLINKSKSAHREKFEDAGEVGTIAHNWIEDHRLSIWNNE